MRLLLLLLIVPPCALVGCAPADKGFRSASGMYMLQEHGTAVPATLYGTASVEKSPSGFASWTDVVHYYLTLGPDSARTATVTFESTEPFRDTNYLVQIPEDGVEASGNILYASFVSARDTSIADSGYVHLSATAADSLVGDFRLYLGGNGLAAQSNPRQVISGRIILARRQPGG